MKALVIENEIYLAQNIANKLNDNHLECTVVHSFSEVQKDVFYDVILASFGTVGNEYVELSKIFPRSIIILMIAYINDDTVVKPLLNGVTDYIVKPFIVDELIRKITHYKTYREINEEIRFYRDYFNFVERELGTPEPFLHNPPFVIKSNSQRGADIYAMKYAREKRFRFKFYSLKEVGWKLIFRVPPKKDEIFYLTNLEELKKNDKKEFLEIALKYSVIISIVSNEKVAFPQVIDISRESYGVEISGEILSVKEYEKIIISKFENRYPDIELAKKLGMSRKSLWEKRKKYGIMRKNKKDDNEE